jgi:molecular chaperone Hsp33
MQDYVVRATVFDGYVRAIAVRNTNTVQTGHRIHGTYPTATAALGRTMSVATMMSTGLKSDKEKITIQITGDGPLGRIVVIGWADGSVKGLVSNPDAEAPSTPEGKLNVGAIVGRGQLTVIKDLGLREPYIGQVRLVSGEIGEDFAYYFLKSEQIPSAVAVGVLVGTDGSVLASGGYLIQTMPGISSDIVEQVETSTKMTQPVSTMINKGLNPEDILRTVLKSEIKELQRNPVQFQCDCSRDRMERALISLGNEELHTLSHGKNTELVCHFCNSEYLFTPENIDALRKQATNSSLEGDSESS